MDTTLKSLSHGTLFVCGTPIGNLEDITLRALRVLREVDFIAAEDTRHTRGLLSHYGISKPLVSYHEHNRSTSGPRILGSLVDGKKWALVTDAGMPSVSDPGSELVRQALAQGIGVVPVPGPSAVSAAVSVAGASAEQFVFVGFLPRKRSNLMKVLSEFARSPRALVAYEAPHRLVETLRSMVEVLGDRDVLIAREITKVHEELFRGSSQAALDHFSHKEVLGEITIVVDGATARELSSDTADEVAPGVEAMLRTLLVAGTPVKEAARVVAAETGLAKNEVYRRALAIRDGLSPGKVC